MASSIYKSLRLVHYAFMKNIDPSFTEQAFNYPEPIDPTVVDAAIANSIRLSSNSEGFDVESTDYAHGNPANRIASAALTRVSADANFEFPKGDDRHLLLDIDARTRYPGRIAHISNQEADFLAIKAHQLIATNKEGGIKPPFGMIELKSIELMITRVGEMALRSSPR